MHRMLRPLLAATGVLALAGGLLAVTVRPWQLMMRAGPWAEATP